MANILSQPYPLIRDTGHQLRVAAWISVFVTLFLLLFRPFGLSNYDGPNAVFKIGGYGLLTFVVLFLVFTGGRLLKADLEEDRWTTGKEIASDLIYIFFIGLANVWYTHVMFGLPVSFYAIAVFQLYTLLIGIFPVSFFVLLNQSRLSKANVQSASVLNEELAHRMPSTPEPGRIRLIAENDKEEVDLAIGDLVLIEAADNYSTVYFLQNGKLQNRLLRSSLKRMESQARHRDVLRCHRTYIVNLQKVISVTGNAQGYRLRFEGLDQSIPVSRAMNEVVKERLQHLA